jgi:hypothetical protein
MTINVKYLILVALVGMVTADARAQQRFADIEAELLSPSGAVVSGSGLPLNFYIKNLGPDDLVTGDTIYYQLKFENAGPHEYTYIGGLRGDRIPAGSTSQYAESYQIMFNFGAIKEPVTLDFCLWLFSSAIDPVTRDTIRLNYTDTNFSNNKHCKSVRVLPRAGSGMVIVDADRPYFYPNPAVNQVTLHWRQETAASVRIFDAFGRQVLEGHLPYQSAQSAHTLDVSALQSGVYHVHVQSGSDQMRQKLIIQR